MGKLRKQMAFILSVVLLVSLFAVPAFAEETITAVEICEMLNVLKGTGEGLTPEYLASRPERYQAAIMLLRLKNLEDDAYAFTGTANFPDVEAMSDGELSAQNKAVTAYLFANPELGFNGYPDGTFRPRQLISGMEFYKVLLTALGYKQGEDFMWGEDLLNFSSDLGFPEIPANEEFTIKHFAEALVKALEVEVKGGGATLIEKLVEEGIINEADAIKTGIFETSTGEEASQNNSAKSDRPKKKPPEDRPIVVVDGRIGAGEWDFAPLGVAEENDYAKSIKVINDSEYLYFCIQGEALSTYPNTIVYIDADNSEDTGYLSYNWGGGYDYMLENGGFSYFPTAFATPDWNWESDESVEVLDARSDTVIETAVKLSDIGGIGGGDTITVGFSSFDEPDWNDAENIPVSGSGQTLEYTLIGDPGEGQSGEDPDDDEPSDDDRTLAPLNELNSNNIMSNVGGIFGYGILAGDLSQPITGDTDERIINAKNLIQKAYDEGAIWLEADTQITNLRECFINDPADTFYPLCETIIDEAHDKGIKVCFYFSGSEVITNNYEDVPEGQTFAELFSDWLMIDQFGNPMVFNPGDLDMFWLEPTDSDAYCTPLSPGYREAIMERAEKLAELGADGIFVDVPYFFTHESRWSDFSEYSETAFKEDTGYDLPRNLSEDGNAYDVWIDWRYKVWRDFFQEMRDRCKSKNPNVEIIAEEYPSYLSLDPLYAGFDAAIVDEGLDIAAHEYGHKQDLGGAIAYGKNDWMLTRDAYKWYQGFNRENWSLCYATGVNDSKALAAITLMHQQTFWEAQAPLMCDATVSSEWRRELMDWIREYDQILNPAQAAAEVAIVFSGRSRDLTDGASVTELRNLQRTLDAEQIPYVILHENNIERMHDFEYVIFPDTRYALSNVLEEVSKYEGNLLLTGNALQKDEWGENDLNLGLPSVTVDEAVNSITSRPFRMTGGKGLLMDVLNQGENNVQIRFFNPVLDDDFQAEEKNASIEFAWTGTKPMAYQLDFFDDTITPLVVMNTEDGYKIEATIGMSTIIGIGELPEGVEPPEEETGIVVDGIIRYNEWDFPALADVEENQYAKSIKVTNDSEYLYICIEGETLNKAPNTIIFVDADNNSDTGYKFDEWEGGFDYNIENSGFYYYTIPDGEDYEPWDDEWMSDDSIEILLGKSPAAIETAVKLSDIGGLEAGDTIRLLFRSYNAQWDDADNIPVSGSGETLSYTLI